jgi:hypothetical protein
MELVKTAAPTAITTAYASRRSTNAGEATPLASAR